ncbi:MAG: hypothetical protein IM674_11970 [Brevundimonas sp.]|jgi:hypothetical protein|nr:hypothetical protein [Brevundimonas sp.]MCA3718957.1 hypothetical protein [Brevundimonas sp.]
MSLTLTLSLMIATAALGGYAGWRGAQPVNLARPRLVPWRFIMLLCAAFGFLLLVHLAALFGIQRPS